MQIIQKHILEKLNDEKKKKCWKRIEKFFIKMEKKRWRKIRGWWKNLRKVMRKIEKKEKKIKIIKQKIIIKYLAFIPGNERMKPRIKIYRNILNIYFF